MRSCVRNTSTHGLTRALSPGASLRLPVFATFQGGGEAGTTLERIIRHRTIPSAAALIVPSQMEATRVTRTYGIPTTKIAPIPNPVDVITCGPADRQRVRAELGIGSSTRVVAWHGRVQIRKKGLDTLVDAWNQICAERPSADILLLLVGSGQNVEELRARLQSSRKVTWIDRYVFDRHELWSYLMAADIYTMPSRDEGFAVAPLEAMACGLPVVASNARGVLDVLPRAEADGGVIVPRENAPALARALTRLIDDPDARVHGSARPGDGASRTSSHCRRSDNSYGGFYSELRQPALGLAKYEQ